MAQPNVLCAFSIVPNKIGGQESLAVEIARQLKSCGRHLVLCFEGPPTPTVRKYLLEPGNVSIEIFQRQADLSIENARQFCRLIRKYKPESVYYTLGGIVRLWPLLARAMGAGRVVYNDGTSRLDMGYKSPFPLRLLMRPVTDVVCASEFIRACTERERFVPRHKCSVIYNSVPQGSELGDGMAFRRRYGISEDRILVLKVSWMVPEKGIDVALQACREAVRQRDDLHFVFCGDGENRQEYQSLAAEWGLADHVTWTGQVEDLRTSGAFRAADIQIQCSQWHEAFCLAVAEGMSAGLPVVAARIGGLPELVVDGRNGYLFETGNHLALAQKIVQLAGNQPLRKSMGEEGRQRAMERFNLTRNVHDWVRTLLPREQQISPPYGTGHGREDIILETP